MEGIVLDCLHNLVTNALGADQWPVILQRAGLRPDQVFARGDDIADETVMSMFASTCELGRMSFEQACEVFGHFWVSAYVPRHYPEFYAGLSTTRQMLVKLDEIHATMRQRMPNAQPPRHTYEWKDDCTLLMGYWSHRPLMQLFLGAVNGVARHYGETIRTRKVDEQHVEIVFPA
jgi:Haem-NO-binding